MSRRCSSQLAAGRHRRHGQFGSHKGRPSPSIRAADAKLFFLPKNTRPTSPYRTALRQAQASAAYRSGTKASTVCLAIGQLLDSFTPQECANYFVNSGMRMPKNIPL